MRNENRFARWNLNDVAVESALEGNDHNAAGLTADQIYALRARIATKTIEQAAEQLGLDVQNTRRYVNEGLRRLREYYDQE